MFHMKWQRCYHSYQVRFAMWFMLDRNRVHEMLADFATWFYSPPKLTVWFITNAKVVFAPMFLKEYLWGVQDKIFRCILNQVLPLLYFSVPGFQGGVSARRIYRGRLWVSCHFSTVYRCCLENRVQCWTSATLDIGETLTGHPFAQEVPD